GTLSSSQQHSTEERLARPLTRQRGEEAEVADVDFVLQEAPQRIVVRWSAAARRTVWSYRTHRPQPAGPDDLLLLLEHIAIDKRRPSRSGRSISLASSRRPRRAARWATWTTRYSRPASADSSGSQYTGGGAVLLGERPVLSRPRTPGRLWQPAGLPAGATGGELPYLLHSPTRLLLLRLGAEDGVYPCGLISNATGRQCSTNRPDRVIVHEAVPHLSEGLGAAAARLQPDAGRATASSWGCRSLGRRQGRPGQACSACTLRTPMECWRWLASSASQPMRTWLPGSRLEREFETVLFSAAGRPQIWRRWGLPATAGVSVGVTGLGFMALSTRLGSGINRAALAAIVERRSFGVICSRQTCGAYCRA
uniref:Ig-like domain-containing protein n=1 Tax=Macrostomum lignano TaxID=282301 RepID=A0A1I8FIC9_9PLAT